ncbi:MAG: hypothetical protein HY697_03505 [Deltaproteobacteria bacterium]|nr:hypothetical protein [Deltaproteobacteria bacterium]
MMGYLEAYVEEGFDQEGGPPTYSNYDILRQMLKPEFQNLSDSEINHLLQNVLSRMSPEEVEGFWDTVKSLGRGVLGAAQQVAPKVLPIAGGALGTLAGGPVGTAFGTQLGQMASKVMAGPQPPSAAPGVTPQPTLPQPAPGAAVPVAAPIPPGGTSAVGQLMSLVQNPAFLQSLLAHALGPAAQKTVSVGAQGTPASIGSLMNALSSLAGLVAREAAESYPDTESLEATAYLQDASGAFVVDPADPDARSQRLLQLLQEAPPPKNYGGGDPLTEWLVEAQLIE